MLNADYAKGFLNYRLKYCWPKVDLRFLVGLLLVDRKLPQPNELEWEMKKKTGAASGGPTKNLGATAHPAPLTIASCLGYLQL